MAPTSRTADAARAVSAVFFVLVLPLGGCGERAPEHQAHTFEGPTMGTTYQVKVVAVELAPERKEAIDAAIQARLDEVNGLMSTYLEDSELSRFNRHTNQAPFELADATWEVFHTALDLAERSVGALDITIGPLVNAWGFGPGQSRVKATPAPSDDNVASIMQRIGYQKLKLTEEPKAVSKSDPDLYCDLSSLAKGYAVDRVAAALEALGEADFMVEVGGEIRAQGNNDRGHSWRIGIERPQLMRGSVQRIVALEGMSMATSGDYRNYREVDGERFSHIMDPRIGRPVKHRLASVTVLHPDCVMADGWATALLVLGEQEGFELASRENLAALFLVRDAGEFSELPTPAFEAMGNTP